MITYEFPAWRKMPPVKVTWFDGGLLPLRPDDLEPGRRKEDAIYLGEKGVIMHQSHGGNPRIIPETKMREYELPEKTIPRSPGIYDEWIEAIKNDTKSTTDFSYTSRLCETMILGNIAILMQDKNTKLEYDGENMKFINVPEANDFLHYKYRIGWEL